jgi:hypothetical protein
MRINILIFEDTEIKVKSLEGFLALKLKHELDCDLTMVPRIDDSMLESDLMTKDFHMILIDDDLGNNKWGNQIIDNIFAITDDIPEVVNVPKIYYSAGTSVEDLKSKTQQHGYITCVTFEHLVDVVFDKLKAKYFNDK